MTQIVQAVFENGVLRPLQQLQLSEHAQVRVTVETVDAVDANGSRATPLADPLEGLCVSTGIADLAERFDDYRFGRQSP